MSIYRLYIIIMHIIYLAPFYSGYHSIGILAVLYCTDQDDTAAEYKSNIIQEMKKGYN